MKDCVFIILLTMTCTTIFAQEGFKIGLQGGLPIIDFKDEVALSAGLDIGYMHALGEVVDAGVSTGLIYGFHETFHNDVVLRDLPDVQFIPIAASVRVWPSNSFSFGLEGGYALGINKGNDGGLYYRPIIGYLVSAAAEINFSYSTIDLDSRSWNSLNFGVLFTFIP